MSTQTLRNGVSTTVNLQPTETLKVVAVTGTYTLHGKAGSVAGTIIATAATGGTYGPYPAAVTLQLTSSALSEIDFDFGTAPVIESDTPAMVNTNPFTGGDVLLLGARSLRLPLILSSEDSADAAARNAYLLQLAMNTKGRYEVYCDGAAQISSQLVIGGNTDIDFADVELKARGAIGSLIVTSAYLDAGTVVTVGWTAGMTSPVTWANHGFVAGEHVWLNRADQPQFCGVFRIESVTDANTFVIQLMRLPSAAATGTIVGRRALENLTIKNIGINYNAGTNTGTGNNLHAVVIAGVWNLTVENVYGKNTQKYLVCAGALSRYTFKNIGGAVLNSDVLKVYGPAFAGVVESIYASKSGDDFVSFQTREPAAYVAYDFCHGDVLGASVKGLSGTSLTGAFLLYASPFGLIDGVTIDTATEAMGTSVPHCRIETLYPSGTSEIGTVTLSNIASADQKTLVSIGSGANPIIVKNLVLLNPAMRSSANSGRLVSIGGSNVIAAITSIGGYISGADNAINCGNNTGRVTFALIGTRMNVNFATFRASTAGILDVILQGVIFENNFGSQLLSAAAGTGILRISANGTVNVAGGAATYSMGAGSSLRLGGNCDIPLDGALLDATATNHAAGAGFYNTNAAFGAGVGYYVRGSTTWTRTAA